VHVVVDRDFLPGEHALLVPKTADGRVLFAVPWLGKLVLGTTDTPRSDLPREPRPLRAELDFILGEAARYLARAPTRADVRSIWVGLRPLVRPVGDDSDTGSLSREHTVLVSAAGLVTVTGGKWTTYRAMAEDVLARCFQAGLLPEKPAGVSEQLKLIGAEPAESTPSPALSAAAGPHIYGSEQTLLQALPGAGQALAPGLDEAMVRFAARYEYALTVEDFLARRSRLLFLDAALAASLAPRVAAILAEETGRDPALVNFLDLARSYLSWPSEQDA
jgi:glycerol-3-phosphate dehydrogenase